MQKQHHLFADFPISSFISHHSSLQFKRRFTLLELLITVAGIAILASMLMPALSKARESSRRISCINNLKQLTMCDTLYAQDFDSRFSGVWGNLEKKTAGIQEGNWIAYSRLLNMQCKNGTIFPYVKQTKIFKCPSISTTYEVDYAKNMQSSFVIISRSKSPTETILFTEEGSDSRGYTCLYGPNGTNDGSYAADTKKGWNDRPRNGHSGGNVFSYFDGHAGWNRMSWEAILYYCDFPYREQ